MNGNLYQERWYGPDGKPIKDRHHTNHGNAKLHPKVSHDHDWGYNDEGDWKPGPWYSDLAKPIIGMEIMVTTSIAMAWVVGNDITGVGFADDMSIVTLGGAFSRGIIMIFGG